MKFIYRVLTNYGAKLEVEAESAQQACKLLGITIHDCRKWYPSPIKRVKEPHEVTKQAERLAKLRQATREKRKLRKIAKRVKAAESLKGIWKDLPLNGE